LFRGWPGLEGLWLPTGVATVNHPHVLPSLCRWEERQRQEISATIRSRLRDGYELIPDLGWALGATLSEDSDQLFPNEAALRLEDGYLS
jgi:hypothetical protein